MINDFFVSVSLELEATPKSDATRSGEVRMVVFLFIILVGLFLSSVPSWYFPVMLSFPILYLLLFLIVFPTL